MGVCEFDRRWRIVALVVACLAGCTATPPDGFWICAQTSDCPDGQRCYQRMCRRAEPGSGPSGVGSMETDMMSVEGAAGNWAAPVDAGMGAQPETATAGGAAPMGSDMGGAPPSASMANRADAGAATAGTRAVAGRGGSPSAAGQAGAPSRAGQGGASRGATPPAAGSGAVDAGPPPMRTDTACQACDDVYVCLNSSPNYTCRGQFPDWPPAYTRSAFTTPSSGIVKDSRSGLEWQRDLPETYPGCAADTGTDSAKCMWAEAKQYCARLQLGGTGWRLPTKAEFESIVDDSSETGLDASLFPNTPGNYFWTASAAADGMSIWLIGYDGRTLGFADDDGTQFAEAVRCVRSP
jgi:hypothetical protein